MDDTFLAQDAGKARSVLTEGAIAYLAVIESDGPYVVPVNYAHVPPPAGSGKDSTGRLPALGGIVFHSGPGRKTAALDADPRVSLAVTLDTAFEAGPSPCEDGFAYRSVIVEGRARLLTGRDEREAGLRAIVEKYDPGAAGAPFNEQDLARTLVYQIEIEAVGYKERLARGSEGRTAPGAQ